MNALLKHVFFLNFTIQFSWVLMFQRLYLINPKQSSAVLGRFSKHLHSPVKAKVSKMFSNLQSNVFLQRYKAVTNLDIPKLIKRWGAYEPVKPSRVFKCPGFYVFVDWGVWLQFFFLNKTLWALKMNLKFIWQLNFWVTIPMGLIATKVAYPLLHVFCVFM